MTVYRLIQAHAFASARFGNSYRILQDAVEEYTRKAQISGGFLRTIPNGRPLLFRGWLSFERGGSALLGPSGIFPRSGCQARASGLQFTGMT